MNNEATSLVEVHSILLEKAQHNLLQKAKTILQIENKKWPDYVRTEFAELREAINEVETKSKELTHVINELRKSIEKMVEPFRAGSEKGKLKGTA